MGSNLLECSICLSNFKNPHILPGCGHTFCLECIEQIPQTTVGFLPGVHATTDKTCPLCRKRFHSRLVTPNFALQHVVTEAPAFQSTGAASGIGELGALNVNRVQTNADVAGVYRGFGVPPQLAQLLAEEDHSIALRIYILDNSGSMAACDGQVIEGGALNTSYLQPRRTTRWEELKSMALHQAAWNAKLGVPSEFVLLNSSNPSNPVDGRDFVRIDAQKAATSGFLQWSSGQETTDAQILKLKTLLDHTHPGGSTPLTERLINLTQRLRRSAPELQEHGRKMMLILVTDGCPNGSRHAFTAAIRSLSNEYPVHIVVRLCTNDDSVSDYYNEVDNELELSLDILDDFQGEAKAIHRFNPWLTYPMVLHNVREAGTLSKLLDFLDERSLTPMEVGLCAQLLLRPEGQAKYPWQPDALLEAVEKDLAAAPSVFCIRRRAVAPLLNLDYLRPAVHPGRYSAVAQVAGAMGLAGVAEAWYEGRTLWDAFQHPKVVAAGPPSCKLCTRTTDGTFPHCCRTCQRSGGKQHGPTCERRNGPAPTQCDEILQLGTVPAGVCFLCARATDGGFPHCCRTCERTGGTSHGPTCESRHALVGYPQAKGRGGKATGRGGHAGDDGYFGTGGKGHMGGEPDKGGYLGGGKGAQNATNMDATNYNQIGPATSDSLSL